jgi:protein-tyrosine phosphatase
VHHPLPLNLYDAVGPEGLPHDAVGMGLLYVRSVLTSTSSYLAAVRLVAELDGPVLIHCSHGKDRTGIVVAVLLSALGVEPAAIVDDFVRTGENLPAMHRAALDLGVSIGLSRIEGVFLEAPAEAMATFLDVMERDHGGVLGPLLDAGLDASCLDRLRSRAVQPRP